MRRYGAILEKDEDYFRGRVATSARNEQRGQPGAEARKGGGG